MATKEGIFLPHSEEYEEILSKIFHGGAAGSQPGAIVQPRTEDDIRHALKMASSTGMKICVRGGGHSGHCSASGAMMLDLSRYMNAVTWNGKDRVVVAQGGAIVGDVLRCLAQHDSTISVGVYGTPGMGLVLQGGIGYLTRSCGLTLDAIEEIRAVRVSDGASIVCSADDPKGDAFALLRGAAPFLAIVTEITLRPIPQQSLHVMRAIYSLESIRLLIAESETLPHACSCSLVLGVPPSGTSVPVAMMYAVGATEDAESSLEHIEATHASKIMAGPWHSRAPGLSQCPLFELPCLSDGQVPSAPAAPKDRHSRPSTCVYSLLFPSDTLAVSTELLDRALKHVPNESCTIALQHCGGAVAKVAPSATAFAGRQVEWSMVITAIWDPSDTRAGEIAQQWAKDCFMSMEHLACGLYIVERHPEQPDIYQRELKLAFGENLPRIKRLREAWDPHHVLLSSL